jgi:trimethylamine---corrinoid protein Co-methyltransferase
MARPRLTVLTDVEIQQIHHAALRLLSDVGMSVPPSDARGLLRRAGGRVDESGRCSLPPALVEEALGSVPKSFRLCDRGGGSMSFPTEQHFHISGSNCLRVLDYDGRVPRQPTMDDLIRFTRLADALPLIAAIAPQVTKIHGGGDEPAEVVMLRILEQLFGNTTKHCLLAPLNRSIAEACLDMGELLAGGRALADRPVISIETSPNSPLVWDEDSIAILMMAARRGAPIFICSLGLAGMSVPITVAGSLALVTAQCLFSLVLAWLVNPAVSFVWGALGDEIMDMRTAEMALAGPEDALGTAAGAQMAHYYGLPALAYAPHSDGKLLDEQVGMEKMGGMLSAIAAGAEISMNAGSLNKTTVASYEQMIIDHEMLRYVYRYGMVITVNAETLGYDAVKSVGPGGTFMATQHTLRHLRTGENEYLRLFDRKGISTEVPDLLTRAHEQAEEIIQTHRPAVPEAEKAQLADYVQDRIRHFRG